MTETRQSPEGSSRVGDGAGAARIRAFRVAALTACIGLSAAEAGCGDGELSGSSPFDDPSIQNGVGSQSAAGAAGSSTGTGGSGVVSGSNGEVPVMPTLINGMGGAGSMLSGTGGIGPAGIGPAGAAGNAGTGNVEPPPGDCSTLPPPSPLEGWASVSGRGVATTTGGGSATPIVVTTLEQLQSAVAGTNSAVIRVQGKLAPGDIAIGSNKTIVGTCGAEVHGHLEFREAVNVIVRNLTIVGYGEGDCARDPGFDPAVGCSSGDDAITVQRNSHHVWFDHCAVRDGTDGNLDVSNGADFVTISWTKFSYTPRTDDQGSDSTGAAGHRYSNLVGGTDNPSTFDDASSLNVTWHHNWWADNVVERQPRIRFGQNHLYNNYYSSATSNYCIRAGIQSALLLEANSFEGSRDPHEFNSATDETGANIALGAANQYTNITGNRQTGGGGPAFTDPPYDYRLDAAADVRAAVMSGAGPR